MMSDNLNDGAMPKVSIVMQCSMVNYSNSKVSLEDKFRRAVNSFLNQDYKNCELVIVSDGCRKTELIYLAEYQKYPNIRFVFYDKKAGDNTSFVKNENGDRLFRGYPRNIGIGCATGDIIAYMDADDVLTQHHVTVIATMHKSMPDRDWLLNASYYAYWDPKYWVNTEESFAMELPNMPGKWVETWTQKETPSLSVFLVSHKSNLYAKWYDSINVSDDSLFISTLMKNYPNYDFYDIPTYIYCHDYLGRYDI